MGGLGDSSYDGEKRGHRQMMKNQILEAARVLIASGLAPSKISAADLAMSGACTEPEFENEFDDLPAFQRELATWIFADARDAVIHSTAGTQPGLTQLTTAFITYLDYNLAHPALQELAHQIQCDAKGWQLLSRMEAGVAMIVQLDLESMNANMRSARAQLLTALAVFVVRNEYRAGKVLPDLREALLDYSRRSAS